MAGRKNKIAFFTIVIFTIMLVLIFNCRERNPAQGTNRNPVYTPEAVPAATDDPGWYKLDFPESFNRSLASQDDLGISILVALDCSGSMGEKLTDSSDDTPKYKLAAASLSEVIAFFADFYKTNIEGQGIQFKLGLLRFAADVKVLYPLTEMNEANFKALLDVTDNPALFAPGGKTAIGKTLETGSALLAQSGTIFKSFIIISDGENTEGEEPETVLTALVENRNNKSTKDFPVLTSSILVSFIGFDLESSVFTKLNSIGSRVMSAFDKEALKDNLKNLFLADIRKLEAE